MLTKKTRWASTIERHRVTTHKRQRPNANCCNRRAVDDPSRMIRPCRLEYPGRPCQRRKRRRIRRTKCIACKTLISVGAITNAVGETGRGAICRLWHATCFYIFLEHLSIFFCCCTGLLLSHSRLIPVNSSDRTSAPAEPPSHRRSSSGTLIVFKLGRKLFCWCSPPLHASRAHKIKRRDRWHNVSPTNILTSIEIEQFGIKYLNVKCSRKDKCVFFSFFFVRKSR